MSAGPEAAGPELAARPQVLDLEDVSKHYGGVRAVHGVTFTVHEGERIGIIGPNGAGKTTLFKLICGDVRPARGRIRFRGADVTRLPTHRRARMGLGRTFQITNLFPSLTVRENLLLAAGACRGDEAAERLARVSDQFGLAPALSRRVGELAYGEQRRLELALALCGGASALLLDEPAAGLGPADRQVMGKAIDSLPRDLTILLIEHDIDLTLGLVDRVICLHLGEVVADGPSSTISDHPAVREIYLGMKPRREAS